MAATHENTRFSRMKEKGSNAFAASSVLMSILKTGDTAKLAVEDNKLVVTK